MLVFDFDGVFTNNKFSLNKNKTEEVILSRADGLAVNILKDKEYPNVNIIFRKKRCSQI